MSVLSEAVKDKIRAYIPRYPSKQAVTLPALHLVQEEHRCVPIEAMREIAEILELNPAEVYDTMSFYGFFKDDDHKLGRTRLWVCRSLPCMLRGADELLNHFREKLEIEPGGTTPDQTITLESAECIGACDGAPCVLIDDVHQLNVTHADADRLIERLKS